ncbi:hypothetical protein GGQ54_003069 [Naumannella cuiyingiana]|uniref:Uncharacterized protein n=1 Tax=Naumannella cuiyingiana TaxID=1347891 RepID=A0A7Z0DBE7_9ACTN|nr:hypothetical protein [Naumannella cuiyingiana]NYI72509.1 hypothetical protein [Naumannella cuiyingiana]
MSNDWNWWFASEYGRDQILREGLENAAVEAAAAERRTSRLRSELTALQGSLEQRIAALSRAFDAYVELGDVREQLAAFPDTSRARLDALRAIDALGSGRSAPPLAVGDGGYWLVHGCNAVIARSGGTPDAAVEAEAARLGGGDFELFWVATLGALGRGAETADRLGAVLASDGTLSPHQAAVLDAVALGDFGPRPDLTALRDAVEADPAENWDAWLGGFGRTDPDQITALVRLIDADTAAAPDAPGRADPSPGQAGSGQAASDPDAERSDAVRARLRGAVAEIVGRGHGEEAPLLARARELRGIVEHPAAQAIPEPERVSAAEAVRSAIADPNTDPQVRRVLVGVAARPLAAWLDRAGPADPEPTAVVLRSYGTSITITADSVDEEQVAQARSRMAADVAPARVVPLLAAAAAALVFAIVLFVLRQPFGGVLAVLAALGLAGWAAVRRNRRRIALDSASEERRRLDREVDEARGQAAAADQAARRRAVATAAAAGELRSRLTPPATASATAGSAGASAYWPTA